MSSSRKLGKKGTANAVTGCKEDDIYDKDVKMSKGSHPARKVQFFFNIVQKAFDPPPFYLNICPILQGVFFKTRF